MGFLKKRVVLAVGGAILGVIVMALLYTFVLSGGPTVAAEPTPEPTVIPSAGKLGPHVTLEDRVFNLVSTASSPVYLKLQVVIEFETMDERWAEVFASCDDDHGRRIVDPPVRAVSSRPNDLPRSVAPGTASGGDTSPCAALEAELLHEFEEEIGTGIQLIEDAVTIVVSSKTPDEVATAAGKEALKEEIERAVERLIDEPHVSRVLFLNFITQ